MQELLIATQNKGKLKEYRLLLDDLPLKVISLTELGITHQVPETGSTFAENARQKATVFASQTGLWTWADDSGLEVDALDGQPGIYSARYGGGQTDRERYQLLMANLAGVPQESRTARFRCAVCIARVNDEIMLAEDTVDGLILEEPRGANGFGYDPLFFVPEFEMTMAELPPDVKNRISHRGKASQAAKRLLIKSMADQNAR